MKENCGIFGIFAPTKDVAWITYLGLFALQHRGQESSGMAVSKGKEISVYKKMGLVSQVFDCETIRKLKGIAAIGHNRYGTTGGSTAVNSQPLFFKTHLGILALAHNGNLANTQVLKKKLFSRRVSFVSDSDTEIIAKVIALAQGKSWEAKILAAIKELSGAYSLLILTGKKLFGVRDPLGVRPLVLGRLNSGFVLASETAALSNIQAVLIKELEPGEVVLLDRRGWRTIARLKNKRTAFCIFEYIYFSRPDSVLNKRLVYRARFNAGRMLAREHPVKADFVMPVPDSGTSAASGFALASKIPFMEGLIKSRYIGRTFIQPNDDSRNLGVRLKFSPINGILKGKNVVVVDDSIVRGTTITEIIKILRRAGTKKIHLRIASPPLIDRCYLGVDIERYNELIAHKKTIKKIKESIGADSLGYLSLKGLKKAIGKINYGYCSGCFTGRYPVPYQQ